MDKLLIIQNYFKIEIKKFYSNNFKTKVIKICILTRPFKIDYYVPN